MKGAIGKVGLVFYVMNAITLFVAGVLKPKGPDYYALIVGILKKGQN